MAKHSEKDFIVPALKVIFDKGNATTSEIKDLIHKYIELNDDDLAAFDSRKTRKESAFRQVIGNLISHRNRGFFSYVDISDGSGNIPKGSFTLNQLGQQYVSMIIEEEKNSQIEHENEGDEANTHKKNVGMAGIDTKYIDYVMANGFEKRQATDSNMKDTVLEMSGRICEYARLLGQKHKTFTGTDGKPYMVAHHLIPLSARKDFFPRNLDRPSNIACLCPTCHDCVHYGSDEERKKMLKTLYDYHIESLNDEQIYITFDELFNKYYS